MECFARITPFRDLNTARKKAGRPSQTAGFVASFSLILHIGHQGDMASPLHCNSQCPLMLCAVPGDTAGKNLTPLGNIPLKLICILVINCVVLAAEYTDFLPPADTTLFPHGTIGFFCLIVSHLNASYHTC